MFKRFLPKKNEFYLLLNEHAVHVVSGAEQLVQLMGDLPHIESYANAIKVIEEEADQVTHRTLALLHKTFITPIDREDIRGLISDMDDIMDHIYAVSQRILLFDIHAFAPEGRRLADHCLQICHQVKLVVAAIEDIKDTSKILKICVEINRLENEADICLRAGLGALFRDEQDTRQLIKLKEVYELMERVTDCAEAVADRIQGIVLEYS